MFGLSCSKFGLKISGTCSRRSEFDLPEFEEFEVRFFDVRSKTRPFTILQNDDITIYHEIFFRLTAPRCPCMAAGAVSLRKSHDIVILSFCNIVKGQAKDVWNLKFATQRLEAKNIFKTSSKPKLWLHNISLLPAPPLTKVILHDGLCCFYL